MGPKTTQPSGHQLWDSAGVLAPSAPSPSLRTPWGTLFEGDCVDVLSHVLDDSVDTVFADPPFNLGKEYGGKVDDRREEEEYLLWCEAWMQHCIRLLKPGGAFFLYNIPKWNIPLGERLRTSGMTFRHWIAINVKVGLPIPNRLYPAHYSLLYFTKGKPKTFRKIRTPIQTCRHCHGEIKDYGGHRHAMNPKGVNLTDVWDDIPPVRHWKFKSKKRKTNQLSTKLVRRAVELTTEPHDVVLDPFGGAGTTYDVCERHSRHWIGTELENCDVIRERLETLTLHQHVSTDVFDA